MSGLAQLPPIVAAALQSVNSSLDYEITQGDLWVLSWDNQYVGLAAIAAIKESFVLAWPVSLPGEPVFSPALQLGGDLLGVPLFVWPTRETGLSVDLLHHRLGRVLAASRIQFIAWAMEDGEDPGLPFAMGLATDPKNEGFDEAMVEHWTRLCFHTWPEQPMSCLSQSKFQQLGGDSRLAGDVLGLAPQLLRPYWRGVEPLTEEQARKLADALNVTAEEILGPDPLQRAVDRLANPAFKSEVTNAATSLGITEAEMREAVRSEYALAARDDGLAVQDAKLHTALQRVLAARRSPS